MNIKLSHQARTYVRKVTGNMGTVASDTIGEQRNTPISHRITLDWIFTLIVLGKVKEEPADCIRADEVPAALKKMKRHKGPGLSKLVAEMIQTTGDIGTQWILDLCNGIVKEGYIPEDGSQVKCCITNLQKKRGSNGVWVLQIVGTCYESSRKDLQGQNLAAD